MTKLTLQATDIGEGEVFNRFFTGYDRAFVLPDEKEDIDGLRAALELNHNAEGERLRGLYGPFREICLVADDEDGHPVGGANFIAMPARSAPGIVTANLSYIYVDPNARGQGNLRRLVSAARDAIATAFADSHGTLRPLIFLEQNDPLRMSAEAYARDTAFTGLDQLDRLRIWGKLGVKLVDFDYVQPPLSPEQGPDDALLYSALGALDSTLAPILIRDHLAGFFGISVLKGAPLSQDPTASRVIAALASAEAAGDRIELLDPMPLLAAIDGREALIQTAGDEVSFCEMIRANAK